MLLHSIISIKSEKFSLALNLDWTNMTPPMDKKTYRITFTNHSISKAAGEISITTEADGIKNVTASFDGTWPTRVFVNGVVTCISEGTIFDNEVLWKVCPRVNIGTKRKTLLSMRNGNCTMIKRSVEITIHSIHL